MRISTLTSNLRYAQRNREAVHVGGGQFEAHEIRNALADIQLLIASTEKLIGHTLHYAAMPHAHSGAPKDAADAIAILKKFKE